MIRWSTVGVRVRRQRPSHAARGLAFTIPLCVEPSFEPTYHMGAVSGRYHLFLSHVWGSECNKSQACDPLLLPNS